jgi:hypothetical protein
MRPLQIATSNVIFILFIVLQRAVAPAPPELTVGVFAVLLALNLVDLISHFVLIGNPLDRKHQLSKYLV